MNYFETDLPDWKSLFSLDIEHLKAFVFRGQQDSNWDLETSIERAIKDFSPRRSDRDIEKNGIYMQEKWMIEKFQRSLNLYNSHLPERKNPFECLAIMQHYGSPTRLLDFTRSFFVTIYFAIISARRDASVWAIHATSLWLNMASKLEVDLSMQLEDSINDNFIGIANTFISNDFTYKKKNPGVLLLEPVSYNERLSRQQGLFLMHTISTMSFMDNLYSVFDISKEQKIKVSFDDLVQLLATRQGPPVSVFKINIPVGLHDEIIEYLNQMNISTESLFPGLEGMAKSLFQTHIRTKIGDW